ncbi:MAG: malonyl-CoA synthase [Caulobacteraceae bacterium]|nr:malonyl-CoA synthase [Caulobacteraceae bacterium]
MTNHLIAGFPAFAAGSARPFIEKPDGAVISYGDARALSGRLANLLVALGVMPGDRVAVQVEKSAEALLLDLACVRAGAVLLPLNTDYKTAELDYFVGDSQPAVIVGAPARAAEFEGLAARHGVAHALTLGTDGASGSLLEQALAQPAEFADVDRDPSDPAAILYTSGTTGRSKGALLSHGNLASNAATLTDLWRFTEADVLLHALPIFHTHGLFVATNIVLTARASMVLLPRFDVDEVFRLMPKATTMMGVPTFYVRLAADARLTRQATAHMRLFVSGSAPLLAETHRQFADKTGQAILERYGMTETNMNTSNPYDGERRPGTVGPPLPDVDLRIVDAATGAPLPQGEIGMIEVKGPNVFAGYWRMPEKTAQEFRPDGFFITGDLGVLDADGYVFIVGRGKDLVIAGGYNIYPKEIEGEIDAIPGVVESAVIGVPHKDLGEGVVAVVVGAPELTEAGILAAIAERLARFKQPRRVILVDELPRNAMGKVQKAALRERYANLLS